MMDIRDWKLEDRREGNAHRTLPLVGTSKVAGIIIVPGTVWMKSKEWKSHDWTG